MNGFKKKYIINIMGGLGNQMFQYAFGIAYQHKTGIPVMLDTYKARDRSLQSGTKCDMFLDAFQLHLNEIPLNVFNRCAFHYRNGIEHIVGFLLRKLGTVVCKDVTDIKDSYIYNAFLLKPATHSLYVSVFFQNPNYFNKYRDFLLNDFRLKRAISSDSQVLKDEILSKKISVAIHVRRGDYVHYSSDCT
ncbi:alpha-1,2-fucosyltransferase [uncultured Parabacteroides sp.]|uniref:alpha-1,2-fucosyltransferase n=1 Tax=uncultured Parabacteroides sp. TaxID=512312 RepID=UPI00262D1576|nr:alpha-1,2-fucosyltransferase [uncultured Parabacteroides sp.]